MTKISTPAVVLTGPDGKTTFELYPYRAKKRVVIFQGATGEFPHEGNAAGIVYVTRQNGIQATDYHVDDPTIFAWVKDWMQKGMNAEREQKKLTALLERAQFALRDIQAMPQLQRDITDALTMLPETKEGN